ncbi:MAG TPA: AAC(3) family N-acetyltransferase [Chloroflexota bacterium]
MPVTIDDIRRAVRAAGLSARPLCVHSSLRFFGWVDGGAATVVRGLLDEGCTILVPSFSLTFSIPPPPHLRPPRNAWDYDQPMSGLMGEGRTYTPSTNEISRWLGIVPTTVVQMEGRVRGNHPLNSFSAVGPLASDLIERQQPDNVYAPLERLAELQGAVVLMGVGLTSMTLIHLAERLAGRTLFRRWANDADGEAMMMEVGSCSTGFNAFDPVLAPLERHVTVGESLWRIFPAGPALAAATNAIRHDPTITHCGKSECRCNDAVLGGPILDR